MISDKPFRRLTAVLLTGISLATIGTALSVTLPATPAFAQSVEDFHVALESYGFWQQHPRFGEVWVPFDKPRSFGPKPDGMPGRNSGYDPDSPFAALAVLRDRKPE